MIARAKSIEWSHSQSKFVTRPWQEWHDSRYGFHIQFDPDEETDSAYTASWGEDNAESFASLDEAQQWCRDTIQTWVSDNVIVVDEPVESEGRIDAPAIAAAPELADKKALVLYFETEADRDEMISACKAALPNARTVKVP